jgi:ribosomal protein S18 acetylase RimI-like enzyme
MAKMIIRKFRNNDAIAASKLIKKTLLTTNSAFYPKRVINCIIKAYNHGKLIILAKERDFFVAVSKNKIVGTIQISNDGWICCFFVHPNYQNQGIGARLLKHTIVFMKKRNFKAVRLHSSINSTGFYKKYGFRLIKKTYFKEAGNVHRMYLKL